MIHQTITADTETEVNYSEMSREQLIERLEQERAYSLLLETSIDIRVEACIEARIEEAKAESTWVGVDMASHSGGGGTSTSFIRADGTWSSPMVITAGGGGGGGSGTTAKYQDYTGSVGPVLQADFTKFSHAIFDDATRTRLTELISEIDAPQDNDRSHQDEPAWNDAEWVYYCSGFLVKPSDYRGTREEPQYQFYRGRTELKLA